MVTHKSLETDVFVLSNDQSDRVWVHSKKGGGGRWLYNSDIQRVLDMKEALKKDPTICPVCGRD